ncbi:MAG: hypothetical protein JO051_18340, partial [Acidobacteriaceae bacterium]|nr:hypothetical protein [Acidobacteriaceae bacterium]
MTDLVNARDRQDLKAIDEIIQRTLPHANVGAGYYTLALAYSYGAEVALEL